VQCSASSGVTKRNTKSPNRFISLTALIIGVVCWRCVESLFRHFIYL